jgi:hypothetical protein
MNMKKIIAVLSAATLVMSLSAAVSCGRTDEGKGEADTYGESYYQTASGAEVVLQDGITRSDYPIDTYVGEWLAGCAAEDRDDHFEAYTLRHRQTAENGNTTFTYFIYYPHGGEAVSASAELLEGNGEYVIRVNYEAGPGVAEYSLCRVSVTIPSDESPRLRLLVGEETLGVLSTVAADATQTP